MRERGRDKRGEVVDGTLGAPVPRKLWSLKNFTWRLHDRTISTHDRPSTPRTWKNIHGQLREKSVNGKYLSYLWRNNPSKCHFSHSGRCTRISLLASKVRKYLLASKREIYAENRMRVQLTECITAAERKSKKTRFLPRKNKKTLSTQKKRRFNRTRKKIRRKKGGSIEQGRKYAFD